MTDSADAPQPPSPPPFLTPIPKKSTLQLRLPLLRHAHQPRHRRCVCPCVCSPMSRPFVVCPCSCIRLPPHRGPTPTHTLLPLHKPPTIRFGIGHPPTASAWAARSGVRQRQANAVRKNEEGSGRRFRRHLSASARTRTCRNVLGYWWHFVLLISWLNYPSAYGGNSRLIWR